MLENENYGHAITVHVLCKFHKAEKAKQYRDGGILGAVVDAVEPHTKNKGLGNLVMTKHYHIHIQKMWLSYQRMLQYMYVSLMDPSKKNVPKKQIKKIELSFKSVEYLINEIIPIIAVQKRQTT